MASQNPMTAAPKSFAAYSSGDEESRARSDYFYDMLDQLLLIGQGAGGEAATDAMLIKGLIASRRDAGPR